MREKETETEEAGSERKGREEWNERFSGWLRKRKSKRKKDSAGRRVSCDLRGLLSCCPRGGNPLGQVGSGRPAFSMSRSINTEATGSLSVPSPQSHLIHHGPPPPTRLRLFPTTKLANICWLTEHKASSIQTQLIDLMPSSTARRVWITKEP